MRHVNYIKRLCSPAKLQEEGGWGEQGGRGGNKVEMVLIDRLHCTRSSFLTYSPYVIFVANTNENHFPTAQIKTKSLLSVPQFERAGIQAKRKKIIFNLDWKSRHTYFDFISISFVCLVDSHCIYSCFRLYWRLLWTMFSVFFTAPTFSLVLGFLLFAAFQ